MTRARWSATALLISAFLVGGLAGGVAVSMKDDSSPPRREGRRGGGGGGHLGRLTTELQLSPIQQDSIQAILTRFQPMTDSMWREIRPAFDAIRLQIRNDIRGQLTPDQQQAYDTMIERQEREYRQRSQRRDRGNRGTR